MKKATIRVSKCHPNGNHFQAEIFIDGRKVYDAGVYEPASTAIAYGYQYCRINGLEIEKVEHVAVSLVNE